jgi:hypothetical protein
MQIHAVTEPFNLQAAMTNREIVGCRSILAAADLHPAGRMTLAEVDRKLSGSRLTVTQRLAAKVALQRAGILV